MEKDISNLVIIEFSDGSNIAGSLHHKIEVSENIFKRLEDISINDKINNLIVTNIIITNDKNKLYDLLDVEHENKYQTNNIISHNCAFIYDVDKTWTAAQQTMATGGRAIVLSTPNGVGN